jgi:hypothetical protein
LPLFSASVNPFPIARLAGLLGLYSNYTRSLVIVKEELVPIISAVLTPIETSPLLLVILI